MTEINREHINQVAKCNLTKSLFNYLYQLDGIYKIKDLVNNLGSILFHHNKEIQIETVKLEIEVTQ